MNDSYEYMKQQMCMRQQRTIRLACFAIVTIVAALATRPDLVAWPISF